MHLTIVFTLFVIQLFSQSKGSNISSSKDNRPPQNGIYTQWYANGSKKSETAYKDGYKKSKYLEWHENEILKTSGRYDVIVTKNPFMFDPPYIKMSVKVGVWKTYDESGNIKSRKRYRKKRFGRKRKKIATDE